ncbi:MAG: SRPBCC family protein [Candidatus Dojkabacteria bacterium]
METKDIKLYTTIKASPHQLYNAFMDAEVHSKFTGASAVIDPKVGGEFKVWDGSLHGKTLELQDDKKIVQEWRSDEDNWPEGVFSTLTLEFNNKFDGTTEIVLTQTGVPEAVAKDVEQGWEDYYWKPLKEYFK